MIAQFPLLGADAAGFRLGGQAPNECATDGRSGADVWLILDGQMD